MAKLLGSRTYRPTLFSTAETPLFEKEYMILTQNGNTVLLRREEKAYTRI